MPHPDSSVVMIHNFPVYVTEPTYLGTLTPMTGRPDSISEERHVIVECTLHSVTEITTMRHTSAVCLVDGIGKY